MARGTRNKQLRRLRVHRRAAMKPLQDAVEAKKLVRLRAYTERQIAKNLATEGKEMPTEMEESVKHAEQLDRCDEQKRRLREKGVFFFVHPNSAPDTFPVVEEPKNITEFEGPDMFEKVPVTKTKEEEHQELFVNPLKPSVTMKGKAATVCIVDTLLLALLSMSYSYFCPFFLLPLTLTHFIPTSFSSFFPSPLPQVAKVKISREKLFFNKYGQQVKPKKRVQKRRSNRKDF